MDGLIEILSMTFTEYRGCFAGKRDTDTLLIGRRRCSMNKESVSQHNNGLALLRQKNWVFFVTTTPWSFPIKQDRRLYITKICGKKQKTSKPGIKNPFLIFVDLLPSGMGFKALPGWFVSRASTHFKFSSS